MAMRRAREGYVSAADLNGRGWSGEMMRELLGDADSIDGEQPLYLEARVREAEMGQEFRSGIFAQMGLGSCWSRPG